ncbi:MAG: TetR family transcriptional regulator [Acidimicrobiales bacterium]|nr:TetR family transcriptional regulator [Acidimicrobiales bacterium]
MVPPEPATRERLLRAAVDEFARHGLAGARVERIARRAGANKQLVYYYFGSKEGLFDAAVTTMARRLADRERTAGSLAEWLLAETAERRDEPHWTRLLAFEALQAGQDDVHGEQERRGATRRAVQQVRAQQRAGRLPRGLDAAQLLLAVHALSSHAATFPQLVRHATGRQADDPAGVRARNRFLRELAALIDR